MTHLVIALCHTNCLGLESTSLSRNQIFVVCVVIRLPIKGDLSPVRARMKCIMSVLAPLLGTP